MTAPFSFAVQLSPAKANRSWADLARHAEDLGYRAVLVPDHMSSGGPLTATAVAGTATRRIKVGPLMLAVGFQGAATITRELATLQAMIGNRLEIGLGAGWMRLDYETAGEEMPPASVRIAHLRSFVLEVRERWSLQHPPPGTPSLTIVMGGGGPRILELAAEMADVVSLSASMWAGSVDVPVGHSASLGAFVQRVEWIHPALAARSAPVELQCLVYETRVTADVEGVLSSLTNTFGLPADELARSPLLLAGEVGAICRKLEELREKLGISYWVVKGAALEDFAPVVDRLAER